MLLPFNIHWYAVALLSPKACNIELPPAQNSRGLSEVRAGFPSIATVFKEDNAPHVLVIIVHE